MVQKQPKKEFYVAVTDEMRTNVGTAVERHRAKLDAFAALLQSINQHINLISRRSSDDVFVRHILHSLVLVSKPFASRSMLVDWGSGGGLPAIPVALASEDVSVIAVDATTKKMRAVSRMSEELQLPNLKTWTGRADVYDGMADYSLSRATAPLATLWKWHARVERTPREESGPEFWRPGLLCLKGGNLDAEIESLAKLDPGVKIDVYDISELLEHAYFKEKVLIHVFR